MLSVPSIPQEAQEMTQAHHGRAVAMKTIRQLREERGWSQELLASYLRVTQGAISQW